jgi:hypothetical protein
MNATCEAGIDNILDSSDYKEAFDALKDILN